MFITSWRSDDKLVLLLLVKFANFITLILTGPNYFPLTRLCALLTMLNKIMRITKCRRLFSCGNKAAHPFGTWCEITKSPVSNFRKYNKKTYLVLSTRPNQGWNRKYENCTSSVELSFKTRNILKNCTLRVREENAYTCPDSRENDEFIANCGTRKSV